MSVLKRGVIFTIGTVSNAILFLFHSRVVLRVLGISEQFADGPATSAMNALPMAMQIAMGALQIGLVLYFIGGIGQERTVDRRPM